jgi:SAM-dependent methyltransferase
MTKAESAHRGGGDYIFSNAHRQTANRFPALSDIYDARTIECFLEIGVDAGWRCLEAGAGAGSIAAWLCDRVGPTGHVVATDIDTHFLDRLHRPNLTIRQHDMAVAPVEPRSFDLVHARLLLVIVPERERALANMIAGLKPGGLIVCEEFDSLSMAPDATINPAETELKSLVAMRQIMPRRGVNVRYGRLLHGRLRQLGCVDVRASGRLAMWQGGSDGARLLRSNIMQLRTDMIESGLITEHEFEADMARLEDPAVLLPSPVMWTVVARAPS